MDEREGRTAGGLLPPADERRAIRYLVAGGIKWRAMPVDLPAWDRVYAFWRRWRDKGLIAEFHDRLSGKVRANEDRDVERPPRSSTRSR
ncbi:transposase [Streptomyces sp. NBC_01546]|uniref:transposase n=1 Tax=Streptomyces sp. NBC_01546 TaxID=2975872 RepID=UPI00224CA215|nr:transposase [Streptomyces sp. NBC_00047]